MTDMPWTPEPDITINGTPLTVAQSMAVRVAIVSFALSLKDGLGDDEIGKQITQGYLSSIASILRLMQAISK
jgi:hypothetical protein